MSAEALWAHLETGCTTVARAWTVTRRDGVELGFTDHDRALTFAGLTYLADAGMTARAFERSTGLSVDNTEALGVLSHEAIRTEDIASGLYDGAEVRCHLVNWADTGERRLIFRGHLGEVEREGLSFRAELRGLAEALNQPQGRVYQGPCSAVLGDASCGFDTTPAAFSTEAQVIAVEQPNELIFPQMAHDQGHFRHGRLTVLGGSAAGTVAVIKRDRDTGGQRRISLWEEIRGGIVAGDAVRLEAGCDKRAETCRGKFDNFLNFRGFPHIPGEDWLMSYPVRTGRNDGGSLR